METMNRAEYESYKAENLHGYPLDLMCMVQLWLDRNVTMPRHLTAEEGKAALASLKKFLSLEGYRLQKMHMFTIAKEAFDMKVRGFADYIASTGYKA